MNLYTEIIGSVAGVLTTLSFLPQVIKTLKTKSASDLSLGMYFLLSTGVALWLVYGLLIGSFPIIAANAVTLVMASAVLAMKLKYR